MSEDIEIDIGNAAIAELQAALTQGRTDASALVRAYLARIEAYDRAGPLLNAVREVNSDAATVAASLDRVKPSPERPLAGIPIL
jgi:amidase